MKPACVSTHSEKYYFYLKRNLFHIKTNVIIFLTCTSSHVETEDEHQAETRVVMILSFFYRFFFFF